VTDTVRATAQVAPANLFPRVVETPETLAALPVGAMIVDRDGDTFERLAHGMWRGNAFPNRVGDAVVAVYLPVQVTNHAELAELVLDGYRLGDLVRVATADYWIAVTPGTVGVVERIQDGYLWLRFQGGLVLPLKPSEAEPEPDSASPWFRQAGV
jgi:hypothetical protein